MTKKDARLTQEVTHVNPKFGRRSWVKLWVNEWLDGTTRFEMTDVQRAFWTDLLAMAGRSRYPGRICAGLTAEGLFIGYPLNRFQALMSGPIDIDQTLALFERTGKIKMTVTCDEPKLVMLELLNWDKYQSEYQRQKRYRAKGDHGDSDDTVTPGGYNQGNKTEGEGEGEGEKKEKKVKSKGSAPRQSAKDLVEQFTLEEKHRTWGAKNSPSVPLDVELDAWKDRMRANGYLAGKVPVKDPQAAFYTSCRKSEEWGTYKGKGDRYGSSGSRGADSGRRSETPASAGQSSSGAAAPRGVGHRQPRRLN